MAVTGVVAAEAAQVVRSMQLMFHDLNTKCSLQKTPLSGDPSREGKDSGLCV